MTTVITGLEFAGNINFKVGDPSASPSVRFGWNAATLGTTAPFAAYPATYIWRAKPKDQESFWTMLFHADYVTSFTGTERYYGMHPYPDPPDFGPPTWEISSHGGDLLGDAVFPFDRWYTCVAITSVGAPDDNEDFYWDWPDQTKFITNGAVTKSNAANPAIIVGDAPWNVGFENMCGVLRGFQYYDTNLTLGQVQNEIDTPGSFRTPWYLNLDPTPNDISDKSGAGHNPVWIGSNRPTLWTEGYPAPVIYAPQHRIA